MDWDSLEYAWPFWLYVLTGVLLLLLPISLVPTRIFMVPVTLFVVSAGQSYIYHATTDSVSATGALAISASLLVLLLGTYLCLRMATYAVIAAFLVAGFFYVLRSTGSGARAKWALAFHDDPPWWQWVVTTVGIVAICFALSWALVRLLHVVRWVRYALFIALCGRALAILVVVLIAGIPSEHIAPDYAATTPDRDDVTAAGATEFYIYWLSAVLLHGIIAIVYMRTTGRSGEPHFEELQSSKDLEEEDSSSS